MTLSPNMNLPVPTVGVDVGPAWALNVNASLEIIDQHNHTPGAGVPIPVAGLNINANLPFGNFSATGVQAVVFNPQSVATNVALYASGVDLWFNDGSGNQIRMTAGGAVNSTSSGISSGTASASFVSSVLVVNQASNTPGNIQCGSVLLGNNVANSKFLTLQPPSAMAANYSLTLPSIPGSQSFLAVDTSGNITGYASVAGGLTAANLSASAGITGSQLSASANILGTQLAALTVGAAELGTGSVTPPKLATQNAAISNSCGTFTTSSGTFVNITQLALNVTNTSRPFMIFTQSDGGGGDAAIDAAGAGLRIRLLRGATEIARTIYGPSGSYGCTFQAYDPVAPGSYTYTLQAESINGTTTQTIQNIVLVVYEMA